MTNFNKNYSKINFKLIQNSINLVKIILKLILSLIKNIINFKCNQNSKIFMLTKLFQSYIEIT